MLKLEQRQTREVLLTYEGVLADVTMRGGRAAESGTGGGESGGEPGDEAALV